MVVTGWWLRKKVRLPPLVWTVQEKGFPTRFRVEKVLHRGYRGRDRPSEGQTCEVVHWMCRRDDPTDWAGSLNCTRLLLRHKGKVFHKEKVRGGRGVFPGGRWVTEPVPVDILRTWIPFYFYGSGILPSNKVLPFSSRNLVRILGWFVPEESVTSATHRYFDPVPSLFFWVPYRVKKRGGV